jgi:hypothetical protein
VNVPGTFKNRPPTPVRDRRLWTETVMDAIVRSGALVAEAWLLGECQVVVAREPTGPGGSYQWHLSVSHESRYPTWDEIKTARYGIPTLPADVTMAQILPPVKDAHEWVNVHENCFHLYEIEDAQ